MATDFEVYDSLLAAVHEPRAFRLVWDSIVRDMVNPWSGGHRSGELLDGHIPYDGSPKIWQRAPELFAGRGIYVWGAWTAVAARIQYIGIADKRSLRYRFGKRYKDELRRAHEDGETYLGIPEAYRAIEGADLSRYENVGLRPLRSPNQRTRNLRAHRYAMVGLQDLWHFAIPVRGSVNTRDNRVRTENDKELEAVERLIIQAASATLFEGYRDHAPRCFPLVNLEEVLPNPFISAPGKRAYTAWVQDGPWWPEMERQRLRVDRIR